MRGYCEVAPSKTVNKCIGSELVCIAQSKRMLYLLTQSGDVKFRLKLDKMTGYKLEQLIWRPIGERLRRLVPKRKEALSIYGSVSRKLQMASRPPQDWRSTAASSVIVADAAVTLKLADIPRAKRQSTSSHTPDTLAKRLQKLLGSDESPDNEVDAVIGASDDQSTSSRGRQQDESSVGSESEEVTALSEFAGACVDSRRDIMFASTGEPCLYALWLLSPVQPQGVANAAAGATAAPSVAASTNAGVAEGNNEGAANVDPDKDWWLEDAKIDLSGPPPLKPFVAGAIACASTSARKPGFLYAVDRNDCRRVLVIRYTAEACIGAVGPEQELMPLRGRSSNVQKESILSSAVSILPF